MVICEEQSIVSLGGSVEGGKLKKTLIIICLFIVIIVAFSIGVYFGHTLTKVDSYSIRLTKDIYLNKPPYQSKEIPAPKVLGQIRKGSIGEAIMDGPISERETRSRVNFPVYLDSNSFERID